jgi:ATP-dependent Clp protease ATP-binding subunit ClpA
VVEVTRPAGQASGLARMEARRLGHHYLGPEHLLLGLLLERDNLAARVLVAHGLALETVRAEVDRLIDQGVLPGPQPSDGDLLTTLASTSTHCSGSYKTPRTRWRPTWRPRTDANAS